MNQNVFAQEATESASSTTAFANVQYNMVYPGMLPDNPLYFLKTIRDRVVSWFIADQEKRAEFLLVTSDKRLGAGMMVFDKKEYALGITSISKSNNYMFEAVNTMESMQRNHKDISSIRENLYNSMRKHEELLNDADTFIPNQYKDGLHDEQKKLQNMLAIVQRYRQK